MQTPRRVSSAQAVAPFPRPRCWCKLPRLRCCPRRARGWVLGGGWPHQGHHTTRLTRTRRKDGSKCTLLAGAQGACPPLLLPPPPPPSSQSSPPLIRYTRTHELLTTRSPQRRAHGWPNTCPQIEIVNPLGRRGRHREKVPAARGWSRLSAQAVTSSCSYLQVTAWPVAAAGSTTRLPTEVALCTVPTMARGM